MLEKLKFFPIHAMSANLGTPVRAVMDNKNKMVCFSTNVPTFKIRRILRMANFSFKLMKIYSETQNEREVLRLLRAEITAMS